MHISVILFLLHEMHSNNLLVDLVNFKIIAIVAKNGIHMPFAFFNTHSIKDFQLHQARRMTKK